MTALEDTREVVTAQARLEVWELTARTPGSAGDMLTSLLARWPDIDLPTIRIALEGEGEHDRFLIVRARRGPLVDGEPGCPSCHVHGAQPHTEYCQLVDHASQLTHIELYGPLP